MLSNHTKFPMIFWWKGKIREDEGESEEEVEEAKEKMEFGCIMWGCRVILFTSGSRKGFKGWKLVGPVQQNTSFLNFTSHNDTEVKQSCRVGNVPITQMSEIDPLLIPTTLYLFLAYIHTLFSVLPFMFL